MNRKEYYRKLKQWEGEGYDVSELREKWFPTEKRAITHRGRWIAIAATVVIAVALVVIIPWPTPEPTVMPQMPPAPTPVPTPAPTPVPAPVPAPVQPAPPILESIELTPASATIKIGETQQFEVEAKYSDMSTRVVTPDVTWVSSNTTVATINSAGLATAVGAGTTTIRTSLDGKSSDATLIVAPLPTGQYRVRVTNNDNNNLEVFFKTDADSGFNNSITVAPGSTVYSEYGSTTVGERTITIQWTDPDIKNIDPHDTGTYYESEQVTVTTDSQETIDYTIRHNPLYHIKVINNTSVPLEIFFKADIDQHYLTTRKLTIGGMTTASSNSWPITKGNHTASIMWYDYYKGETMILHSSAETFDLDEDIELVFTIE